MFLLSASSCDTSLHCVRVDMNMSVSSLASGLFDVVHLGLNVVVLLTSHLDLSHCIRIMEDFALEKGDQFVDNWLQLFFSCFFAAGPLVLFRALIFPVWTFDFGFCLVLTAAWLPLDLVRLQVAVIISLPLGNC